MDNRGAKREGQGEGNARLLVFAKYPRPGRVKTRLVPPLTEEEAADLYAAMLCDSLQAYRALPGIESILCIADPEDAEPARLLLREQGVIPEKETTPLQILVQRGNDLGERLLNAFADVFACGPGPVAVIGTDHPSLPLEYIPRMFEQLNDHDLVLGPADDGGYYTLGLHREYPALFRDMPWSTADLFRRTVEEAGGLGLRTHILPEWYDVDDRRTLRRLMEDRERGRVGARVHTILSGMQRRLTPPANGVDQEYTTDEASVANEKERGG